MNEALQRKETHPQIDLYMSNLYIFLYRCFRFSRRKTQLVVQDNRHGNVVKLVVRELT